MRIRPAEPADLPVLQDLEVEAGRMFRTLGMDAVAEDEPADLATLERFRTAGGAWVLGTEPGERVAAYLLSEVVDGALHIEQVSTHPKAAGRGAGLQLIEHAAVRAREAGLPALTLTTFREVPWNAPYYARLGFRPVEEDRLTPGLREIRAHEAALGLDRWPRLVMRRPVPAEPSTLPPGP